jgi:hypothetical protein
MSDDIHTLYDLCKVLVKYEDPIELIETAETKQQQGNIFESLWKLILLFGSLEKLSRNRYIYQTGCADNRTLNDIKSIVKYLKTTKIKNGNETGSADIVLRDNKMNRRIFWQCKWYGVEKSVSNYDIEKMMLRCHFRPGKDIFAFTVKNRTMLLKNAARASSATSKTSEIAQYLNGYSVFGSEHLRKYYYNLREILKDKSRKDYDDYFMDGKQYMKLHFHQKLAKLKNMRLIDSGEQENILACKCRSGKSIIFGAIIAEMFKQKGILNVLLITMNPKETIDAFINNVFGKYTEFALFTIIQLTGDTIPMIKLGRINIIVASKQLLELHYERKRMLIFKAFFDIIGFDENDNGGTTETSRKIVNFFSHNKTIREYITGTPMKTRIFNRIPDDNIISWQLEHQVMAKKRDIKGLVSVFGEDVYKVLGDKKDKYGLLDYYDTCPELQILCYARNVSEMEKLRAELNDDSQYGASVSLAFKLEEKEGKTFANPNAMKLLMTMIFGSGDVHKLFTNPDEAKPVLQKISDAGCRTPKVIQLFIPPIHVGKTSKLLENILKEDPIAKRYKIVSFNNETKKVNNMENHINIVLLKQAKAEGKDGLIIITGKMLSRGISIPACDLVVLLHDGHSSDTIVQQMFRCMTEDGKEKKYGFMVDFNAARVITTCVGQHASRKKGDSIPKSLKTVLQKEIVGIDLGNSRIIKRDSLEYWAAFMRAWNADPIKRVECYMREISNIPDPSGVHEIIGNKTHKKEKNKITKGKVDQDSPDCTDGSNNKKSPKESSENSNSDDVDRDEEDSHEALSLNKHILPSIIPHLIGPTHGKKKILRIMQMVEYINSHKEDRDAINNYGKFIFNCDDTIGLMLSLSRYIEENELANDRCQQLKMELNNLIDNPREALKFMASMLVPKEEEKKQLGAVYTSEELINTMLDKLPSNTWSNPKLTILDPSSGIGNFMVVIFHRLMKGLKTKIPDDEKRKRHILCNMLFMSEIDPKSVRLCYKIFDTFKNYNMNIHLGDSLVFKHNKEPGWPSKFDLIVGNPPYNKSFGGKNGYAAPLYHEFVEKYIDKCDKLLFVLPTRGFTGGRGLDRYRQMMLGRRDIAYIDTIPDSDHPFGTAVQIKGGVCHFLKDSSYDGKCSYNGKKIQLDTYDILVDSEFIPVIEKVKDHKSITDRYCSKGHYKIGLTDKRLHKEQKKGDIVCHVSKMKGGKNYIRASTIPDDKLGKWKVVTVTASTDGGGFGNIFVAEPNEVHSESFISFETKTKKEAQSLESLLRCRLSNLLLSLRKPHTHNIASEACKWIPSVPLNRNWTDTELYKHLKFNRSEIKLVDNAYIPGLISVKSKGEKSKKTNNKLLAISSSDEIDDRPRNKKQGCWKSNKSNKTSKCSD